MMINAQKQSQTKENVEWQTLVNNVYNVHFYTYIYIFTDE